jgi:hypothetical protein
VHIKFGAGSSLAQPYLGGSAIIQPKETAPAGADWVRWGRGCRGTVAELSEHAIKINWDSGATSYYRRDTLSNVLVKEPPQQ